jgi:hypothetical protein
MCGTQDSSKALLSCHVTHCRRTTACGYQVLKAIELILCCSVGLVVWEKFETVGGNDEWLDVPKPSQVARPGTDNVAIGAGWGGSLT